MRGGARAASLLRLIVMAAAEVVGLDSTQANLMAADSFGTTLPHIPREAVACKLLSCDEVKSAIGRMRGRCVHILFVYTGLTTALIVLVLKVMEKKVYISTH